MNSHSDIEWSVERMALLRRIHELEKENARLRELLGVEIREECPKEQPIQLSLQDKVELFRSLFKGREDVFADYNDINEDTRVQLELINQSLAELQSQKQIPTNRRPIGFAEYNKE